MTSPTFRSYVVGFSVRECFDGMLDADSQEEAITRAEELYLRDGEDAFKPCDRSIDWWAEPYLVEGDA